MTEWPMRIIYWISKATNKPSEYVTLIAFPLPHWLHGGVSMLPYTTLSVLLLMTVSDV